MAKLWDNQIVWILVILIVSVGIFHGTDPGLRELLIFTVLSVLLVLSLYSTNRFYSTGRGTLKYRLIRTCILFMLFSLYFIAVRELTGFSLDYGLLVLFFIALAIFALWEHLDLTRMEKVILVLTLLVIILVKTYTTSVIPKTSAQLYFSKIREVNNFEEFQETLTKDAGESFTREDFLEIKSHLQEWPLNMTHPLIMEYEGGDMILLETAREHEDRPLKVSNIELLPEEVASYFRYYPLEIEREADIPQNMEDDEEITESKIIECRGAFVSHGTRQQKRDWYEQLISVFGDKETWDNIWFELGGIQPPEGPVIGYGTESDGYLEISFDEEWEVDEKLLDKIYKLFHDKAKEHGIEDIPIVFKQRF
ncbi:MAG: hypothetical protein K9L17_00770 [Clostridiales bacterium]|nr:hypothetical protein [Clostridiales bacterium]MCF8021225.1 hypothetical protein [Clostridiales bacterium]